MNVSNTIPPPTVPYVHCLVTTNQAALGSTEHRSGRRPLTSSTSTTALEDGNRLLHNTLHRDQPEHSDDGFAHS
jgi:hypothetical protein